MVTQRWMRQHAIVGEVKRLNHGEDPNTVAEQELPKWNKAGSQVVGGLTRRRAKEVDLFQTYTGTRALPC